MQKSDKVKVETKFLIYDASRACAVHLISCCDLSANWPSAQCMVELFVTFAK